MRGVDYLRWELERQQAALRALLSGGKPEKKGELRNEERIWEAAGQEEMGRNPAGAGAALRYSAWYAGEDEDAQNGFPSAREEVQKAERTRRIGESGGLEARTSSGKAGLDDGTAPLARESRGKDDVLEAGLEQQAMEKVRQPQREGPGSRAEGRRPFGGDAFDWEARERPAETAAEAIIEERPAGADTSPKVPGESKDLPLTAEPREEAAGGTAAAAGLGGMETALRRKGAPAGTPEREMPLFRSLPWRNGGESAALRAEDEARAVSRAVQRDARRYDGSFYID